jgi:hypothetical protein
MSKKPLVAASAFFTVKVTPGIATTVHASKFFIAFIGQSSYDVATVTGGDNPTGTVTFNLYDNATASGTPLFTDTEPLSGGTATSASYTTTALGTDYWVATYNGDSNNDSISSGVADEPLQVVSTPAFISTSQEPASATVGTAIADQATVTGFNPTGTVTFNLYDSASNGANLLFTDTESLVGGVATSAKYTTTAVPPAGISLQWVATYNGDTNNKSVTSQLGDEPVTITDTASPSVLTSVTDDENGSNVSGNLLADVVWGSGNPAEFNGSTPVSFDLATSTPGLGLTAVTTSPVVGHEVLSVYSGVTQDAAHLVLSLDINLTTGAYTATNGAGSETLPAGTNIIEFDYSITDGIAVQTNRLDISIQGD